MVDRNRDRKNQNDARPSSSSALVAWTTSAIVSLAPGAVGGVANVLTGHPIDLVKVRLQTSSTSGSTIGMLQKIFRTSGVSGLYAGVSAPLAAVVPAFAVTFGSYEWAKSALLRREEKKPNQQLDLWNVALAGGAAGANLGLILGPFERIKCLMQVRGGGKFIDIASECYQRGGFSSIFRGTGLTVLREIPGNMAYFGCYEFICRLVLSGPFADALPSWTITLLAGGIAGMSNWIVAIPIDVIKSRWQTNDQYPSVSSCVRHLFTTEGPGAFFKGLSPALLRAFPANAATFLGVGLAKSFLDNSSHLPRVD